MTTATSSDCPQPPGASTRSTRPSASRSSTWSRPSAPISTRYEATLDTTGDEPRLSGTVDPTSIVDQGPELQGPPAVARLLRQRAPSGDHVRVDVVPDRGRRADRRRRPDDQGRDAPGRGPRRADAGARGPARQRARRRPPRGRDRPLALRRQLERAAAQGRPRARERDEAASSTSSSSSPDARPGNLGQPAPGLPQHRSSSGRQPRCCRPEAEFEVWEGLKAIPPYDADDDDGLESRPESLRCARRRGRRGRRGAVRHAGVQPLDPRRAEERARLALAPAGREPAARQAGRGDRRQHGAVRRRLGPGRAAQGARRRSAPGSSTASCRSAWRRTPSPTRAGSPTPTSSWCWPTCSPSCGRGRAGGRVVGLSRAFAGLG